MGVMSRASVLAAEREGMKEPKEQSCSASSVLSALDLHKNGRVAAAAGEVASEFQLLTPPSISSCLVEFACLA